MPYTEQLERGARSPAPKFFRGKDRKIQFDLAMKVYKLIRAHGPGQWRAIEGVRNTANERGRQAGRRKIQLAFSASATGWQMPTHCARKIVATKEGGMIDYRRRTHSASFLGATLRCR